VPNPRLLAVSLGLIALAGCKSDNMFDETGGLKITRSACPALAVPAYTGDVTLFDPPASRDARAIDVVAQITDLRGNCTEGEAQLNTAATFQVQARRSSASGARDVVLPYFATVMRAGTVVVSKQIGQVQLHFNDGELRTTVTAHARADVSRSAATIPDEIERKITRKRKAGDADAAIDPMSDPAIRAVVSRASFELLVGFQLTQDQLAYNATR